MSTVTHPVVSPQGEAERIPPLQNGDRLTRAEFERRYDAMPGLHNAQLIEGVVHMPSPVSYRGHCNPHFNLIGWLSLYTIATPGVEGGDNGTLRLDLDNAPQPDAFLIVLPSHGGQARIDAEDYIVVRRNWSPKYRPPRSASTSTRSSTPTGATASANTSSGACSTAPSIGSSFAKAGTTPWLQAPTCCFGVKPAPACGSTRPP